MKPDYTSDDIINADEFPDSFTGSNPENKFIATKYPVAIEHCSIFIPKFLDSNGEVREFRGWSRIVFPDGVLGIFDENGDYFGVKFLNRHLQKGTIQVANKIWFVNKLNFYTMKDTRVRSNYHLHMCKCNECQEKYLIQTSN